MKQQTATTAASNKVKRIVIKKRKACEYETIYRPQQEERLTKTAARQSPKRESLGANEAACKKKEGN